MTSMALQPAQPGSDPTWGLVTTIRATPEKILNFAAYYLDLGADHLYLFLDEDSPDARAALSGNPRVTVTVTDDDYWGKRGRRPEKHQVRQTRNATKTYRRLATVDWLLNCDVDEFITSDTDIRQQLASLPKDVNSARIRAIEALAPHPQNPAPDGGQWFKGCALDRRSRLSETKTIYPRFGLHLRGGFLSHVEGKNFVRTGIKKVTFRIHNLVIDGKRDPSNAALENIKLCHLHAPDFETWMNHYWYRFEKGAYSADRNPNPDFLGRTLSIHELLQQIYETDGEDGLKDFYDDVAVASPGLCARLKSAGYLYNINLNLDERRKTWFPNH